jgi:hypothetical protein
MSYINPVLYGFAMEGNQKKQDRIGKIRRHKKDNNIKNGTQNGIRTAIALMHITQVQFHDIPVTAVLNQLQDRDSQTVYMRNIFEKTVTVKHMIERVISELNTNNESIYVDLKPLFMFLADVRTQIKPYTVYQKHTAHLFISFQYDLICIDNTIGEVINEANAIQTLLSISTTSLTPEMSVTLKQKCIQFARHILNMLSEPLRLSIIQSQLNSTPESSPDNNWLFPK